MLGIVSVSMESIQNRSMQRKTQSYAHWIEHHHKQGCARKRGEEPLSLVSSVGAGAPAIDSDLVDEGHVGSAGDGVPDPAAFVARKRGDEAGDEHDQVRRDGHEEVGTVHASHQGQIDDDERVRQRPVDVASPEHLPEVLLLRVGDMAVGFMRAGVLPGDAIPCGHGQVSEEGDGRDQGSQDVE